jgi:hypothetical protein
MENGVVTTNLRGVASLWACSLMSEMEDVIGEILVGAGISRATQTCSSVTQLPEKAVACQGLLVSAIWV